jgi:cobalt-zinc-cadmium resistance protein CzcA
LNLQIQKAWSNYQQAIELYQQIQKTLVPNANKMGQIANLSFKEGQIGYIEWSTAMTQVQQIEMQALEALALFHQNQSTLNYLLSK